jgi:holliday junction DNA helicase RuvA
MIGYLKGVPVSLHKGAGNRTLLVLEVNQIGCEVQIPARFGQQLPIGGEEVLQVFTHLQIREDQMTLYGFASASERDLFRLLIGVSGVGAQLAIALLDYLTVADLVQAIITGNTRVLAKTPGVGNKTAERLTLELKTKLAAWHHLSNISAPTSGPSLTILEELNMTLLALGYSHSEISTAVENISKDGLLAKNKDPEEWIRSAIAWLSL